MYTRAREVTKGASSGFGLWAKTLRGQYKKIMTSTRKKIRATEGHGFKSQLGIFRVLDDVISIFKILPSTMLRSKCNVETSKGHLYVVSGDNIPSIPFMNVQSHAGFFLPFLSMRQLFFSADFPLTRTICFHLKESYR